jgi:mercuric ion binding protein
MPIRALLFVLLIVATGAWAKGLAYEVGVDGLACPFCAYGIEKQLSKLDGVEAVETDIKQGRVVVRVRGGKTLDKRQVEQAVKKAGFSLRSFNQAEENTP